MIVAHPDPAHLRAFARGQLADAERTAVADHLDVCPDCCTLLDQPDTDDPFVARLLAAAGPGSSATGDTVSLRRQAPTTAQAPAWPEVPGYEVLEEVGRGGMGVVYKARQVALNRLVALKVLLAGSHASPEQLLRFRAEAEAAARLQHPNIVQIYEVGRHGGLAYLALEFVAGGSLAAQLQGRPLPPQQAAGLVETIARGVHTAHVQGIVHRDLKPGNVLLSRRASSLACPAEEGKQGCLPYEAVPKIADFGLAKHLGRDSGLTGTGAIVGTPSYLAPEQARGDSRAAGVAADVYALGATLYELLTGRPPFQGATVADTLLQVVSDEAVSVRRLQPAVPRDLETICHKCLRKEPEKRYASAQALADDLKCWLTGKPIRARRVGELERARLWARRNPGLAAALAAAVGALLLGSAAATWFGLDAREQARQARRQEGDAVVARNLAEGEKTRAQAAEARAQQEKRTADLLAAEQTFRLGLQQAQAGAVDRGLFLMLQAWRQAPRNATAFRTVIRTNLAGWSRQLPRLRHAFCVPRLGPDSTIRPGDPEVRTILLWHHDNNAIRCWDVATGRPVGQPLPLQAGQRIWSVSRDGRWLALADKTRPGSVLDRTTGKPVPGISWPDADRRTAFFYDLPDLVGISEVATRSFWELPGGRRLAARVAQGPGESYRLTRTVTGRAAAVVFRSGPGRIPSSTQGYFEIVDLTTGKSGALPLAGGLIPGLSYDGRVALQLAENGVTWWDLGTGRPLTRWQPRRDVSLDLTADGLGLPCGGGDARLRLYDLATGLQRGGDLLEYGPSAWGPDGRLLVTLDDARTVRVWDISLCRLQATATANPHTAPADTDLRDNQSVTAVFSADRSRLALAWPDHDLAALLDARTGQLLAPPLRQTSVQHLAFSADGRYLATATFQNGKPPMVVLRDGRTGKPLRPPWPAPKLIHALAFSPDGKTLAVGAVGGTFLLDVPACTLRHHLAEATCINGLLFHADGRRLVVRAAAGWEGVGAGLRLWDVRTGQPLSPFHTVRSAFSPGVAWDGGELVYHVSDEFALRRLSPDGKDRGGPWPTGRGSAVFFSPDGRRAAAGTSSVTVRQLDTRTGKPIGTTLLHDEVTGQSRYSSDNRVLAVVAGGKSVVLWDTQTGWPLGPPLLHARAVVDLAFADDDRTLLTVTRAGVHAWPLPRPVLDDPDRFETWLHARGGRRLAGEEAVSLTLAEWQVARRTLAKRWPRPDSALAELSDDLAGWHRRRARHAAEVGNDRGELYHLSRLAQLAPREPDVHARIAAVHARVAARLPAGPARDRQWQFAWAAAKRGMGRRGEEEFNRLRALQATGRQAWDEALWYLDLLVARHKGDWLLRADRAEVHARRGDRVKCDADLRRALRLGGSKQRGFVVKVADEWARADRWREVAALLSEALKGGPAEVALLRRLALARLKGGDRKAHAALCRSLLRSLPEKVNPGLAVAVLDLCALAPGTLDDWSGPLGLVENAVRGVAAAEQAAKGEQQKMLREVRRSWLTTQAALLHRAGRHADAVARLQEAMKLAPDGQGGPLEWAWLALAHAAAEKAAGKEARRWLERARSAQPRRDGPDLWQAVLLEVLLDEVRRFEVRLTRVPSATPAAANRAP
jgi:WD40 repeat protein